MYGAGGVAVVAAMIAEAVKASGPIVKVESRDFEAILARAEDPLVLVVPAAGLFRQYNRYATSYKGFMFYTDTRDKLILHGSVELVRVKSIWVPGF